jgi:hypothetical protein
MAITKIPQRCCAFALTTIALAVGSPVDAAIVPVGNGGSLFQSEQTTSGGSGPFGNISQLTNPGNYTYSGSFTGPQTTFVPTTSSGFYDDFVFTIGAGQVDSITSSITLGNMVGISSMQVRLYDYNANGGVAPLLTTPVMGTAFDAWSSMVSFPGGITTVDVLPTTTLGAGTYVVEVRGTASGLSGGNFTGSLNVTPVPLPGGLPSLIGGLAMLAIFGLRRLGVHFQPTVVSREEQQYRQQCVRP